jgi:hypothetical protein
MKNFIAAVLCVPFLCVAADYRGVPNPAGIALDKKIKRKLQPFRVQDPDPFIDWYLKRGNSNDGTSGGEGVGGSGE